jgi:hypothetical protein
MIDTALRFLTLLIVAAALLAVNLFAVRSVGKIWFDRGATITPFKIIGGDQALGPAMATLLQARLAELQRQLKHVQLGLTQPAREPPSCARVPGKISSEEHEEDGKPPAPIPTIQLVSARGSTALFEPIDLSVSVGGVDVGSILGWVQRTVISSRVIQFTASFASEEAVVAGDIAPLTGKEETVWLETKQVTPPQIADLLAHKLIAASADDDNIAALSAESFQKLTRSLSVIAELNQRAARGASVGKELSRQLPDLMDLVQVAPHWLNLLYFVASVAESAGDNSRALILYERLRTDLSPPLASADQKTSVGYEQVDLKVKDLRSAPPTGFFDEVAPRILSVTGQFEFGSTTEPARMYGSVLVPRWSEDIEFGFAFWSLKRGNLAPLLRRMRETNPQRFYEIVGPGAEEIDSLLGCDANRGEAFIAQTVRDHKLDKEWQSYFARLGAEPEFQKVQVATLEPFFRRAIGLADQLGLRSEQGLAQMFDWVFLRGAIPKKTSDAIATRIQRFRGEEHRDPDELDRMKLIAEVLADSLAANQVNAFTRTRILYFADPTKSNTTRFPSLESLGLRQNAFRKT